MDYTYSFIMLITIATLATVMSATHRPTLLQERTSTSHNHENSPKSHSPNPTGPQSCNTGIVLKELKQRRNKKLVRNFYQEVFGDKNVSAIDKYVSRDIYIQHNPTIADGREAFKTAALQWFKDAPKETVDIQRISADGDLVWVHTKAVDNGKISSCIDIFRVHLGKIFEHWDVMQDVPEKSANSHPMF